MRRAMPPTPSGGGRMTLAGVATAPRALADTRRATMAKTMAIRKKGIFCRPHRDVKRSSAPMLAMVIEALSVMASLLKPMRGPKAAAAAL